MKFSAEMATLIAAAIAALASVFVIFVTLAGGKAAERRSAIRDLSSSDLKKVGKAIHETIALTDLLSRASDDRWKEKQEAARRPAGELKDLRLEVRYALWGIDEGLRTLTRFPDWMSHTKAFPQVRKNLLERGTALGKELDLAVRDTFLKGSYPGWWRRRMVQWRANQLRKAQKEFFATRHK